MSARVTRKLSRPSEPGLALKRSVLRTSLRKTSMGMIVKAGIGRAAALPGDMPGHPRGFQVLGLRDSAVTSSSLGKCEESHSL